MPAVRRRSRSHSQFDIFNELKSYKSHRKGSIYNQNYNAHANNNTLYHELDNISSTDNSVLNSIFDPAKSILSEFKTEGI